MYWKTILYERVNEFTSYAEFWILFSSFSFNVINLWNMIIILYCYGRFDRWMGIITNKFKILILETKNIFPFRIDFHGW